MFHSVYWLILLQLCCSKSDQSDPLCSKIKHNRPGSQPILIRLEIEEGETFEIKCTFCSDNRNEPVNWYFRAHRSFINKLNEYIEENSAEVEVTADPFTFNEFNRVFVGTDNSLKIRKFNESDIGAYFCKRFPSGGQNGFEYRAELLLRKEPFVVPTDKNFAYSGKTSMNLTRTYHGQDSHNHPFTLILNHLRLTFQPGKWGECSSCGDQSGEQERFSECRVKFSFPHGEPMPDYLAYITGPNMDAGKRALLDKAAFGPYSVLMKDYDELMSPAAIARVCQENSGQNGQTDSFDVCKQKLYNADLGYNEGMGCRNLLQLNRWAKYAREDGSVFPPQELLGGLMESRTCTSVCSVEVAAGKKMNVKAKKLLKKKGLNLRKILKKQRKRAKVRLPKRHVISEYENTGVKFSCPGAKMDHLLLWKNGTLDLNPFLVATETLGRVSYTNHLVLHIKNLSKYDSQVYSCWQNNELRGEVEIKVVKPKEAPPDIRVALLYLAVGLLCDVIIFVGLMIVRHRQRRAVRMKGYKELYDDDQNEKPGRR